MHYWREYTAKNDSGDFLNKFEDFGASEFIKEISGILNPEIVKEISGIFPENSTSSQATKCFILVIVGT